jgi:hypothetical protein
MTDDEHDDDRDTADLSREELERELTVLQAENEDLRKDKRSLQDELERVLAAAAGEGVSAIALASAGAPEHAVALARNEIEKVRAAIEPDLQAIRELHNPPPDAGKVETSLDVVQANNRERAELQRRAGVMGNLLSRLAALFRVERWDLRAGDHGEGDGTEGSVLLEAAQKVAASVPAPPRKDKSPAT